MSKIDVEMEDAEKLHDDPGNNIQKSECKVIDPKVESKKEVPCEAAVSRDLNGRGNGEENLNKVIDEKVEDKMDVKTEVVDQTNSVNEVSEPIQGSDCGTMIAKSENKELTNTGTMAEAQTAASDNKELINTKTAAEAQTAATGAAEKQSNVKLEVVECDATDSEAKEDEPAKNDMVDGNHGEDVEKRSNEDVGVNFEVVECDATDSGLKEDEPAKNDVLDGNQEENVDEDIVEKPGEIGKDTDDTEHVADEMMVENADAGNVPSQNRQLPTESLLEKRPYEDVVEKKPGEIGKDTDDTEPVAGEMMVENADAGNVPSQNRQLPTESLLEKRPNEDVEEKPGEISKDTDDTEPVAGQMMVENADAGNVPSQNRRLPTEFFANKDPQGQDAEVGDVRLGEDEEMEDTVHFDQDKMVKDKEQGAESFLVSHETDGNEKTFETAAKPDAEESSLASQHEPFTPNSLVRCSSAKTADHRVETSQTVSTRAALPFMGDDDDRTPEDQAAFMKELEHFYKERTMEFKLPKFYGQPLNCLKLWRAVLRLGGYDRVTGSKLWRQVGESFHPPKTCTTVSWTFRIFYEKSLLEYERHKTQSGELQLPVVMLPEISGADGEGNGHQGSGPGPGRARRDAAARAMQGWHAQRLGAGEVGEPIIKDKNLNNMAKNEKNLKSIGSLKQKRPNEAEHSSKAPRTDISKRLVTSVVDVGPPADWVKINVRQTKECFEVYALVPGLLREEVRVQSDPAGRLVITGQPEQVDNPWGITPFKKVISLPARIEPVQTSAVVSLHGRLFVRVPLEQPNI